MPSFFAELNNLELLSSIRSKLNNNFAIADSKIKESLAPLFSHNVLSGPSIRFTGVNNFLVSAISSETIISNGFSIITTAGGETAIRYDGSEPKTFMVTAYVFTPVTDSPEVRTQMFVDTDGKGLVASSSPPQQFNLVSGTSLTLIHTDVVTLSYRNSICLFMSGPSGATFEIPTVKYMIQEVGNAEV